MKITIFDTTLRDGEMALKQKLTVQQKLQIGCMLDEVGVDVIEVGYPGVFPKDHDEMVAIAKHISQATICGLASSKPEEIAAVAGALKPAVHGRINVFTPVRLPAEAVEAELIDLIRGSVSLARNYCDDVEWSAFDATRSHPDVVCKAVETAIKSGATTIAIPDSMGIASPTEFTSLIETIRHRVPNIDQATLAVHCHDDQGYAVENSLVSLEYGVRQVECSINGLGARAGNADLARVVEAIAQHPSFYTTVNISLLPQIAQQVKALTEPL